MLAVSGITISWRFPLVPSMMVMVLLRSASAATDSFGWLSSGLQGGSAACSARFRALGSDRLARAAGIRAEGRGATAASLLTGSSTTTILTTKVSARKSQASDENLETGDLKTPPPPRSPVLTQGRGEIVCLHSQSPANQELRPGASASIQRVNSSFTMRIATSTKKGRPRPPLLAVCRAGLANTPNPPRTILSLEPRSLDWADRRSSSARHE